MGPEGAARLREGLVERLVGSGALTDPAVARAMRRVPRHLFLPDIEPWEAYEDQAIATKVVGGEAVSSSSQPAIMAIMLEQLALAPGHRVLEVGAGTGYNAALMADLVGPTGLVVTVDIDPEVAEGARAHLRAAGIEGPLVVCGDGAEGWPPGAPYDRIILTVGAADLAPAWVEQLADAGRLVLPLSVRGVQQSVCFVPRGDHLVSDSLQDCGFMPLRGPLQGPERRLPLPGHPGVVLVVPDARPVDPSSLGRALDCPVGAWDTGVDVGPPGLAGLARWLALRDPGVANLCASGAPGEVEASPVPSLMERSARGGRHRVALALAGRAALAALAWQEGTGGGGRRRSLAVRAWGEDDEAMALARRLRADVVAWQEAGRPATDRLRILAYPAGTNLGGVEGVVVDMAHARLVLAQG